MRCARCSPTTPSIKTSECRLSSASTRSWRTWGAQFAMFPDAYAFEIVNIAGDGPVVLTERLDYIQTPSGEKPAVPVMGTFHLVSNDTIARWTDYFDLNLTVKLLQGEDITDLVPAARSR